SDYLEKHVAIYGSLSYRRERFTECLQHAGNHKIPAELHGISLPRLGPKHDSQSPYGVEQGTTTLDGTFVARCKYKQLFPFSSFRPAKNRSTDELLSSVVVLRRKPSRESRTNGAARNMDRTLLQTGCNPLSAEHG